jgi:hypothetical protein
VSAESDAVRGIALRRLRDILLHHHIVHAIATSSLLQINVYVRYAGAESIGCKRLFQLLETAVDDAVVECIDMDAMQSFSAAAHTVAHAHLHIIPSDLPSAALLLLARDSAVVFVVHGSGSNPELVGEAMQLLGDLPWLHVTHVWENDELLHAKLCEAAEDAVVRAGLSRAAAG